MRSDKEERRAGGFPPEDEALTSLTGTGGGAMSTSTAISPTLRHRGNAQAADGAASRLLGGAGNAQARELERRLAEAELDRTLCMNRIKQLEEEMEARDYAEMRRDTQR